MARDREAIHAEIRKVEGELRTVRRRRHVRLARPRLTPTPRLRGALRAALPAPEAILSGSAVANAGAGGRHAPDEPADDESGDDQGDDDAHR
jgi:hypothetical protein